MTRQTDNRSETELPQTNPVASRTDNAGASTGFVAIANGMAERERAERALRESMTLQQAILNSANFSIISTDADGRIRTWNRTAEKLLGYTAEETLGGRMTPEMLHDREEMALRARELSVQLGRTIEPGFEVFVALARLGQCDEREWTYIRKDGRRFPVRLSVTPLFDDRSQIAGFLGVATDITEQKKTEVQLLQAKETAEAASRAKSAFLANMSHEIRTPMNGVIGMANLLLDCGLTGKQRYYAKTIHDSAESLLNILNDILDFSKIEAGKLTFESIDFDLRETVEQAVVLMAERAHSKKLELGCWIEHDVPSWLLGDPGRLQQILTNLINNAIKFTENGEVVVRVTREKDTDSHALLRFSITDTGIGIPQDVQRDLFQAFTQGDPSTTRKYGGTGLGLAICKQLVSRMDGEIGLESQPSKGSTFWFTARFNKQPLNTAFYTRQRAGLAGIRILILDDNQTNCTILEHQAATWQARTTCLRDPAAALQCLRQAQAAGDPFALALIDQVMPGMDGIAVARAIKADPALQNICVVILTSVGQRLDEPTLEAAGITAWLEKPVRQTLLYNCLVSALVRFETAIHTKSTRQTSFTPQAPAAPALSSLRVLLAEDNCVNQEVASAQLRKLGLNADVVPDGRQAVQAVEHTPYDLIFMDCQMPELDGYEATCQIRTREHASADPGKAARHTYIIAMTANAMQGDREKCLAAGMDDYISKPVDLPSLQAALERWQRTCQIHTTPPLAVTPEPSPCPEPPAPPQLLDHKRLQAMISNDPTELKNLVAVYFSEAHPQIERLKTAIQAGRTEEVLHLAHKCRGASASLGMTGVATPLAQLEQLAREGRLDGAHCLWEQARQHLQEIRLLLAA